MASPPSPAPHRCRECSCRGLVLVLLLVLVHVQTPKMPTSRKIHNALAATTTKRRANRSIYCLPTTTLHCARVCLFLLRLPAKDLLQFGKRLIFTYSHRTARENGTEKIFSPENVSQLKFQYGVYFGWFRAKFFVYEAARSVYNKFGY